MDGILFHSLRFFPQMAAENRTTFVAVWAIRRFYLFVIFFYFVCICVGTIVGSLWNCEGTAVEM